MSLPEQLDDFERTTRQRPYEDIDPDDYHDLTDFENDADDTDS